MQRLTKKTQQEIIESLTTKLAEIPKFHKTHQDYIIDKTERFLQDYTKKHQRTFGTRSLYKLHQLAWCMINNFHSHVEIMHKYGLALQQVKESKFSIMLWDATTEKRIEHHAKARNL